MEILGITIIKKNKNKSSYLQIRFQNLKSIYKYIIFHITQY